MTTERPSQTTQSQTTSSSPEQIPLEQGPVTGQSIHNMQHLQRLVGNQGTQRLMAQSVLSPRVQRAPGLPPVRGVLQRDDDVPGAGTTAPTVDESTAAPGVSASSTSSAAAAYAAVPESDIHLTETEIRNAINYNQGRYQGRSIPALRRYLQLPEGTTFDAASIRAIARYQRHFGLGSDGLLGRATYEHIDLHQMLEQTVSGTPGTDSDLIFSLNANLEGLHWDFLTVAGNPNLMLLRITQNFNVEALFPQHAHPGQFRYRQMIKGDFVAQKDGETRHFNNIFSKIPVTHELPSSYTEDGNTDWRSTGVFYGRRSDAGQPRPTPTIGQNQYFGSDGGPDQRNGHRYLATDGPKAIQALPKGATFHIRIEFLGQIVRTATNEVMQQKHWIGIDHRGTVPSTPEMSG